MSDRDCEKCKHHTEKGCDSWDCKFEQRMTFVEERDKAFIDAVVNDKWDKVRKYSKKYGLPMPKKRNVMKAGVYKAVQYCTNIPENVKVLAMQKCLKIGFTPFIKPIESKREDDEKAAEFRERFQEAMFKENMFSINSRDFNDNFFDEAENEGENG